jgi:hypothetical protein
MKGCWQLSSHRLGHQGTTADGYLARTQLEMMPWHSVQSPSLCTVTEVAPGCPPRHMGMLVSTSLANSAMHACLHAQGHASAFQILTNVVTAHAQDQ